MLVHGAVHGGRETWLAQQPLAHAHELITPDRQGYTVAGPDAPDDPEADAVAISDLLGQGTHLVGFSMGAMVAMLAAVRKPAAVKSLVLIEPVAFDLVRGQGDAETFIATYDTLRSGTDDAERFLWQFLTLLGAEPDELAHIPVATSPGW